MKYHEMPALVRVRSNESEWWKVMNEKCIEVLTSATTSSYLLLWTLHVFFLNALVHGRAMEYYIEWFSYLYLMVCPAPLHNGWPASSLSRSATPVLQRLTILQNHGFQRSWKQFGVSRHTPSVGNICSFLWILTLDFIVVFGRWGSLTIEMCQPGMIIVTNYPHVMLDMVGNP